MLEFYQPKDRDVQTPHDRDEFYFVARGSGNLEFGGETVSFVPGDVLFVEAGAQHRFVQFSDDFATWVLFVSSH